MKKAVFLLLMNGWVAQAQHFVEAAPPVEVGILVGRDGAALGPSVNLQVNPFGKGSRFRGVGFYAYAGVSSVSGYQTGDGVTADYTDKTLGFGVDYRAFTARCFTIGGFAQAAYFGSHVKATYFDPDYGVNVEYRDSDKGPLITIGPEVRYTVKHVTFLVRVGKDFGDNFAATTAGGFSANGAVLVDVTGVGRHVAKLFR